MLEKVIKNTTTIPKNGVLLLIKSYQKTLSPDHGIFSYKHPYGYCKHTPSCSEYSYQAISKYGIIKGGLKSTKIVRLEPFHPEKHKSSKIKLKLDKQPNF